MSLVDSLAFFESIHPISFICLSVRVEHDSKAFSLSTLVLTFVSIAVRPFVHSLPMFLVILPLTRIALSILVLHGGCALQFIADKLSFKDALVLHEHSVAVPFIVDELSIVLAFITVNGLSSSIGHVILPLAFILIPCLVKELSKAVCHVIFQITFIITAIRFYVSPESFTSTIDELSLQIVAIIELQGSESVWLVAGDFSIVVGLKRVDVDLLIFIEARPF